MVLVDTSVLIDYLRNRRNAKSELLDEVLARQLPWGICDYVYQEILQEAKNLQEYDSLREYFETIPTYFPKFGKQSFERAALLNVRCRAAGVTIRSTIDLLIAEIAIENDVGLLHNDSDFENMKKVISELRMFE